MNSIDFNESCVRNMIWDAKKQAEVDTTYEREMKKYRSKNNNNSNYYNHSSIENRLLNLENRINSLEERMKELVIGFNNSNGLFVFAPDQNITSNFAFSLSDEQFKEIINKMNK